MFRTFGLWARYAIGLTPAFEGEGGGGGGGADDVKKALFERDSANAKALKLQEELEALKKRLPSEDDLKRFKDLEAAAAAADEEKKRKAGEFDKLRDELVKKHQTEVETHTKRTAELEAIITDREIGLAFANAYVEKTPLFGDEKALTVLPAELAADALRKYVKVEYVDGKPVVKVARLDGTVVIGKDGKPAPFGDAMFEVINGLPTKDRILRGSGKAGSGSSGGGGKGPAGDVDLAHLTPEQMNDPAIRAKAKERFASAGGISMGSNFDRGDKK